MYMLIVLHVPHNEGKFCKSMTQSENSKFTELLKASVNHLCAQTDHLSVSVCTNQAKWEKSETGMSKLLRSDNQISHKNAFSI